MTNVRNINTGALPAPAPPAEPSGPHPHRARPARGRPPACAALAALLLATTARGEPIAEPSVGVGVDMAYDSNVFNGRGPDMVTRLAPHVSLVVRNEITRLALRYDMGAWFYTGGKAENSLNHRAVAGVESRVTRRLTLRLADEFVQAGDPGFLVRAGVVAPQTSIRDNVADGGLSYAASHRVTLEMAGMYRHTSFGEVPAGAPPLHNGDQVDASAGLAWRAGRNDDLRLSYRLQYFTADGDSLAVSNSPTLAWRHQFLPTLESRVEAGPLFYNLIDGLALAAAGESGITWRAGALLRYATPTFRASIGALRDLVGGTGAASVLWAEYLTAQIGWRPEQHVDIRLGGGLFANGYAPTRSRLYDGAFADAMVDVRVMDGLHIAAYYALRWQETRGDPGAEAAPLPDITRQIVGLRIIGVLGAEGRPVRRPRGD